MSFAVVLILGSLSGCVTAPQTTMISQPRSAIRNSAGVRVYGMPPKHFQEIAIVEGYSVEELRSKAAALGANGLIATTTRASGPPIGVNVGTGQYHYGRHSAYGFDTSASFELPTGAKIFQGTAIYVP